jgi:hypothetical protein
LWFSRLRKGFLNMVPIFPPENSSPVMSLESAARSKGWGFIDSYAESATPVVGII